MTPASNTQPGPAGPSPSITAARLSLAMVVALLSDAVSLFSSFVPPVQIAVDLFTAVLLTVILGGRRWALLLPALVLEAIPLVSVAPLWVVTVGGIAGIEKYSRKAKAATTAQQAAERVPLEPANPGE